MRKVNIFCGKQEGQAKEKLIKFITTSKLSVKHIADGVGCHHAIVYGWLRGEKSIKFSTWDLISKFMDEYKK